MKPAPLLLALLLATPAAAAARTEAPSVEQLSQALAPVAGGAAPHVTGVRCEPSSPGYVRCTYLQWSQQGYTRWAVLVSPHAGRWTVSEGPIRERARAVLRR